jgi:AmiR/NasT family two-component response regulator
VSKKTLRIVIADDEVDMRDYLQKVLPRLGHLVVGVAENGIQLADESRKMLPDLVITDLKNSTYYARIILQQQNELGRKIVELDARPSDCLALAAAQNKKIFVAATLFEQVEDMTTFLEKMNDAGGEPD